VGFVNPTGKTTSQVRQEERELRRIAALSLSQIELNVAAGRKGLATDTPEGRAASSFAEIAMPWVENRRRTCRSGKDDHGRMVHHLVPFFGDMRLARITTKEIVEFIALKKGTCARQTIVNCLNLVSRLYNDLIQENEPLTNPVARLDRATRRAIGPKYDPRKTPFLERKQDIRGVYLALPPLPLPLTPMFAVGVFAGLRTGEIIALERGDVKLRQRRIHVQRSVRGPLKDEQSRFVPINDTLLPILREWMVLQSGGRVLFPPPFPARGGKPGSPATYVREHTLARHLREALVEARLDDGLTWYQCTRHTFASHWVMDGGTIKKLCEILGHASVTTTERYAHLAPDAFGRADYETATVDLREGAEVVQVDFGGRAQAGHNGDDLGTDQDTLGGMVSEGG
jgi:integrase